MKWSRHRPKDFVGVDISETSVKEAKERHISLLQSGRVATPATFHHVDLCSESVPSSDSTFEIVSFQFSLQFMFASSRSSLHALTEAYRVLVPGGVVVGIVPDGDRVAQEFLRKGGSTTAIVGHFLFREFQCTKQMLASDPPVGIPYSFSLGQAEPCTEYLVLSRYLHHLFRTVGYTPVFKSGVFSENAQAYYVGDETVRTIVAALLRGRWCSVTDWDSLASFRVFLARKPLPAEAADESTPPAADDKKKKRQLATPKNGGGRPRTLPRSKAAATKPAAEISSQPPSP